MTRIKLNARAIDAAAVVRVDTDVDGNQAIGGSSEVNTLSADGQFAYFRSTAVNLVSGDTSAEDSFQKNLATGEIQKFTTLYGGQVTREAGGQAVLSEDGRYVAFPTHASLVSGDGNSRDDVYRVDTTTLAVMPVSLRPNGSATGTFPTSTDSVFAAPTGSTSPDISADGRYVVFASLMTDLATGSASGDQNQSSDIFLRDTNAPLSAGVTRISTNAAGQQAAGSVSGIGSAASFAAAISADGHYVVFASFAVNLVGGDTNNQVDIFRKDLVSGAVQLVSTATGGGQSNNLSTRPDISADGRYVTFASYGSNLVAGDTNATADIFRKDMVTGEIVRVSTSATGAQASSTETSFISDDGRYILFSSDASNLVAGDTNGQRDVFRVDVATLLDNEAIAANRQISFDFATDDATQLGVNWGDGATDTLTGGPGWTLNHTYSAVGTFNVTLTATNAALETSTTPYAVTLADPQTAMTSASAGTPGNDIVLGSQLDDVIVVAAGNDLVSGNAGNDTMTGGPGDDMLDGGDGTDTAVFSGTRSSYHVAQNNGAILVTDMRGGVNDGADTLLNVEAVQFTDGTYSVAGLLNNAPVVATPIPDQAIAEDQPFSFVVPAGTFSDADGDTLTYTATLSNGDPLPGWLTFASLTRSFAGTAPLDFNGSLDVTVTASDGPSSASDTFTLDVTPVNDAPVVANPIIDQFSPEDSSFSFQVPANTFSDVDGDPLTYAATLGDGSALPDWLAFNAATRTFAGDPPADFNGNMDLKVTASDGSLSASDLFTLTVSPVNDAPVLTTAGNGMATTDFGSLIAQARSVVVQADGKVVVDGYAQDTQVQNGYISELVRYNADGSIDTTFGTGGIVSAGPGVATGSGVAIQADGKIVTAGAVFGSPFHFALARYNSDGSFDTSFGTGGQVETGFGGTVPFGLLIQPDGKIVLAGGGGGDAFALARFNIDGSFDTSFGTGGKVTTAFGGTYAAGYGIARTPDGKIVVAGIKEFVGSGFDYDFAVARYNDDGSLDTSFGAGGKVTTDFASTDDIPYSVTVQADGKIVVAGITDPGNAANFGLVRYNVDGSLDASFGAGGKVSTDFGANLEPGNSVTIQADGKIIVAGFTVVGISNADFALARYNSDGSLDTSFGTGGKVTTGFGSNSEVAISAVIQPDGKIVVTGSTANGNSPGADFATVRYNSDGSLDTSFGIVSPLGGSAFFTEGGAPAVLNARANVHDIDLDAAGSYAGASLTLARHGGADAQDRFGASGNLAALTEGGNIVLSGVAIGTVTHISGGTLILTFGPNATEARVNEAMRDITYANSSDNPAASVQVDWSFSDGNSGAQGSGGALGAIGSTAVSITAVNDAPVNVIAAQTATEDTGSAIIGLSVSDPDIGGGHITVTLTVQHGTILVRGDVSGGLAATAVTQNGTASVILSGDAALLNATLAGGITYRADPNYNGTDTLTMLSNDGGNTGSGGNRTDSDTVNIVVASVNDAPSIALANNSGAIVRVSTDAAGVQGNHDSFRPVFSPDGSKVAFYSEASNLVAGDTNNTGDVFVKDLATGAITRVSTDAAGAQGDGYSMSPSFSADGSKIAFGSTAANLVPGDNNAVSDVFVKDLATGAIVRVGGTTVGDPSYAPVLSPDGSKVLFYSYVSNFVAGDSNNTADVFIKDLTTGAITRVSTNAAGIQAGNSASFEPVFSPDGSKVAFFSFASDLVAGDSNGVGDIFVKDLASGQIALVSTAANGAQGNNFSSEPVFSPDGSRIAFFSAASNLVPGDGNGTGDAFVKDLVTGAIIRVSTSAAGLQGNGSSFSPVFSPDGSRIAFFSDAINLVAGDSNGVTDVFVKDLTTGAIARVSTNAAGAQGNQSSQSVAFSPDGSKVAFYGSASNLVAGDSNGAADVFVKNLLPDPAAYSENASAVRVATALVTVTDVDNATFGGGSLTAALTAGSHAGDNLTLVFWTTPGTGIEASGSTVKYNGAAIGTLSGSGTAALAVALNGSATAAAVQALAGAVGFASTSDDPTAETRTMTVTLVDGSGTANGGHDTGSFTQTVLVTAVNDAPVNTVPGAISTSGDVDHAIAGLSVSDPDATSLTTTLHVDHGTLTVGAIGGAAVGGSGTDTVTLTGSVAQIDAALSASSNVLYHGTLIGGADHLTMTSTDGGGAGSGGTLSDTDTVAINPSSRHTESDFNGDAFSDILFRNNSTGDTGYTDLHNNVFHSLGGSPVAWTVVGSGDYNGDNFSDILFRNNSTGDTGYTDLHNNVFHSLGGSPAAFSVAGSGDYNGDSFSDILFRNNSTGDTGYTDIHNNVFHSLGGSPVAWTVVGSGDYNGDNFSDILFRNNSTGDTGYTDLHNNVFHSLGGSPAAFSVVGSGDYNGDSFSDILFRNNSTGDTGYTDIHNNVFHSLGGSPVAYSVVGSGDYNGDGFSDILFRNNATGDSGYTDLHNNVFHSLGGSPTDYLVVA
jgi:uncharacterized delta-60 repeat protein